jgi:salicylate hydroxylase
MHPSHSGDFLEMVEAPLNTQNGTSADPLTKLNVIVVGAGLGGLAAALGLARDGHNVTVLEQSAGIGEVGAGIQLTPNVTKSLLEWGISPHFERAGILEPECINFRRWENGSKIGYTQLVPNFRDWFGGPYLVVHRAHFHKAMYDLAVDYGVTIRIDSRVAHYDFSAPSVTLHNGDVLTADLVVACDGIHSLARQQLHPGRDHAPRRTGFACYRATVNVEDMLKDPQTAALVSKPQLNIWIGEGRHVMTYTIAGGKMFNMVLSHPDNTDLAAISQLNPDEIVQEMRSNFEGWDPILVKIISQIKKTMKWPLLSGSSLESWTNGSTTIMGDAAHPMVPYMSQGAAMAVEDAVALSRCFSKIHDKKYIPQALKAFESLRLQRTRHVQEASLFNGKIWHYPDGPEQRARDEAMKPEVDGQHFVTSPNQWSDPTTQLWLYKFNAKVDIDSRWDDAFAAALAKV